jgi:hypothetical protein
MIAQKNIDEIMPVEKAPSPVEDRSDTAKNQPQQKKHYKIFIASDVCLLTGLLLMVIANLLPIGAVVALGLLLLIIEVSLFVVGGELFVLGLLWPKVK